MNCRYCGAEVEEDSKFCAKCGKNIMKEPLVEFDDQKGRNHETKKKKIQITVIVVIVLLIIGVGGTVFYIHQKAIKEAEMQRQAEIDLFQEKSIEIYDSINKAETNFNLMSAMYSASTEMSSGLLDSAVYTSYVKSLCSSEITEEKSRRKEIDEIYYDWKNLDCNEDEIKALKNAIEDYYDAYSNRYNLLVETDFSVYSFASDEKIDSTNFNDKKSAVKEEINMIEK